MVSLLTAVGEAGTRATFREVLAFVSFAIFGGRTCSDLIASGSSDYSRYYWNAFEGEGIIFESLARGLDPHKQTNASVDEHLWRGLYDPVDFEGNSEVGLLQKNLDEVSEKEPLKVSDMFAALKRRWYFEHKDGHLLQLSDADKLFTELQDVSLAMAIRLSRLIALINRRWSRGDSNKTDSLRLWTRLSYSPRNKNHVMVSGMSVARPKLGLYRPELSSVLRHAFGEQPANHLVLASTDGPRFARLLVDTKLLQALLGGSTSEGDEEITRRLIQFNDGLSQYAEKSSDVRTIEILDPESEMSATVVVDLANRRYDSAV